MQENKTHKQMQVHIPDWKWASFIFAVSHKWMAAIEITVYSAVWENKFHQKRETWNPCENDQTAATLSSLLFESAIEQFSSTLISSNIINLTALPIWISAAVPLHAIYGAAAMLISLCLISK